MAIKLFNLRLQKSSLTPEKLTDGIFAIHTSKQNQLLASKSKTEDKIAACKLEKLIRSLFGI